MPCIVVLYRNYLSGRKCEVYVRTGKCKVGVWLDLDLQGYICLSNSVPMRLWCSLTPRLPIRMFQTLEIPDKAFEKCVTKWAIITYYRRRYHSSQESSDCSQCCLSLAVWAGKLLNSTVCIFNNHSDYLMKNCVHTLALCSIQSNIEKVSISRVFILAK